MLIARCNLRQRPQKRLWNPGFTKPREPQQRASRHHDQPSRRTPQRKLNGAGEFDGRLRSARLVKCGHSEFGYADCLPLELLEVSSKAFWTSLMALTGERLECLPACSRSLVCVYGWGRRVRSRVKSPIVEASKASSTRVCRRSRAASARRSEIAMHEGPRPSLRAQYRSRP